MSISTQRLFTEWKKNNNLIWMYIRKKNIKTEEGERREGGFVVEVILKRWVLWDCLNEGSVLACQMWLGREFHYVVQSLPASTTHLFILIICLLRCAAETHPKAFIGWWEMVVQNCTHSPFEFLGLWNGLLKAKFTKICPKTEIAQCILSTLPLMDSQEPGMSSLSGFM